MRTSLLHFGLVVVLACAATGSARAGSETPGNRMFPNGGVFTGNFKILHVTDPLNGRGDTNAFDPLVNRDVDFKAGFDRIVSDDYTVEADGSRTRVLITSPAQISFVGQSIGYLRNVVAPTLNCGIEITIRETRDGESFIEHFEVAEPQTPQFFAFACQGPVDLPATTGDTRIQDADLDHNLMSLQRFNARTQMTDWATGVVTWALVDNIPVAVAPATFSHIKAMYGAVQQ